jgi:succinate dehydrogenase / fumarate reductase membrane anchor subunit
MGLFRWYALSRRAQGLRTWVWQRISALYLGLFLIYFVSSILMIDQFDYQGWSQWITGPFNSVIIFIGFLMLMVHAWVGIKDVIMDYIHPIVTRSLVLMLAGLGLLACLVWLSRILLLAIMK